MRAGIRLSLRNATIAAFAAAAMLSSPGSATAAAPVQPYAANDAGGFRNVLPAGENGLDNAARIMKNVLDTATKASGTGLGLAISAGIMRDSGGELTAVSVP